jgi:hypothetical protein
VIDQVLTAASDPDQSPGALATTTRAGRKIAPPSRPPAPRLARDEPGIRGFAEDRADGLVHRGIERLAHRLAKRRHEEAVDGDDPLVERAIRGPDGEGPFEVIQHGEQWEQGVPGPFATSSVAFPADPPAEVGEVREQPVRASPLLIQLAP